jgi:Pro-kumamolisin, activation domain
MKTARAVALLTGVAVLLFAASRVGSQRQQITQPIDNSKLAVLKGNTHPWAQARFDRGPVAASRPMNQMMLLLKSSPEQGAQLNELLAEQQDPHSANYHKWLTPEEFGSQFGTSEADIQKITAWLTSFGFTINNVANGRNIIQFSGNAGQVQSAFHTSMHNYEIVGKHYVANANDPAIPVALTAAVAGIVSLNNFPRKSASRFAGAFYRDQAGKLKPAASAKPEFTSTTGCMAVADVACYAVTPYDFATIYNVLPLWNAKITGSGQTIAVVSDSDINNADFTNFRSIFDLPAGTLKVIHTNGAPGIEGADCSDPYGCNEGEADVDVEWSGAVAPGAQIDLVVTNDTNLASFGADISSEYVIDNKTAPVIAYSYGLCEFFLGTTGNQLYGGTPVKDTTGEWAQAATEGITVVVSTGDTGATNCDGPGNGDTAPCAAPNEVETEDGQEIPYNDPAVCGLAVNGVASTPYNVAVGGTDFNDPSNPTTYWSSTNAPSTYESVVGYIPETAYNNSCTSLIIAGINSSAPTNDPITNCSNFAASGAPGTNGAFALSELVVPEGGGGGPSNCIASNYNVDTGTGSLTSCTGGYAKPSWQTALTPADNSRDLPDISLFAGNGAIQNFYLYCEQDVTGVGCSVSAGTSSAPYPNILGVGGTSVAAEAFAGVMALLNQAEGSSGPAGLPNQNLYSLAGQSWADCAQASSGTLTSACIFNQVTNGTIEQPCSNTPNGAAADCNQPNVAIGTTYINGEDGYDATAGYNLATGLGSLNIYNLVKEWTVGSGGKVGFVLSASPTAVTISSAGGSGTTTITVVPVNGFTDSVSFSSSSCSGLPSDATCSFSSSSVAPNATTTLTIQTASSSAVPPLTYPDRFGAWRVPGVLALGCALSMAIFFFSLRRQNPRWGAAIGCIVFLAFIGIAGCGSSSTTTKTTTTTTTPTSEPQAITITGTDMTTNTTETTTVLLTVQ